MRLIGIDPGATGAMALYADGRLVDIADMPTVKVKGKARVDAAALGHRLRQWAPDGAWCELVGAMPGQGVVSMFSFGMALGVVLGALGALCIPVTMVAPVQWKGALRVPRDGDGARARASQLIPMGAHHWARAKDDGRAEAALIGLYGIGTDKVDVTEW